MQLCCSSPLQSFHSSYLIGVAVVQLLVNEYNIIVSLRFVKHQESYTDLAPDIVIAKINQRSIALGGKVQLQSSKFTCHVLAPPDTDVLHLLLMPFSDGLHCCFKV